MNTQTKHNRKWNEYLWVASFLYLVLGFFNIMFAWLGLICFITPLLISLITGTKAYCGKYCGRGQLFALLGKNAKLSLNKGVPKFFKSKFFRYGFLAFFLAMFGVMIFNTYLVFANAKSLSQVITLFWTFKLPWQWAGDVSLFAPWVSQFAYGFYSVMLTSTLLGFLSMVFFKPRAWCVYCPMGTMTQAICKAKSK